MSFVLLLYPFHLCPGVLSSPSFYPSILPQPITLVQSPVRPSALYQSNPSNCMHQPICLTHSSPSVPLPLSVVKNIHVNPSPSMFCSGPSKSIYSSPSIGQPLKPFINPWVQSVLVLQLKPPNPSLFEYGGKDFIHPSPLRIPPIQNYPCNQSMPAHRLIINLSITRNPYTQSNVKLSSSHPFPWTTPVYHTIYLARHSVSILWL